MGWRARETVTEHRSLEPSRVFMSCLHASKSDSSWVVPGRWDYAVSKEPIPLSVSGDDTRRSLHHFPAGHCPTIEFLIPPAPPALLCEEFSIPSLQTRLELRFVR
jgi:hypothetical protein